MKSNRKKSIVLIIVLILFAILWVAYNIHYLRIKGLEPLYSLIIDTSGSIEGFLSNKNLLVTYIIPFLIYLKFFVLDEESGIMVRFKTRMEIYRIRTKQVFIGSLLFVSSILFSHLMAIIIFDYDNFVQTQLWLFSLLNLLLLTTVYVSIGVLNYMIYDFSNSAVAALIVTFFISSLIFFVNRYLDIPWLLASNVNVIDYFLNSGSFVDYWITLGKELLVSILMILLGTFIFEKKDFLNEVPNE